MKPTLFHIDKQAVIPQKVYYLLYSFHITLTLIFCEDKGIIQIYDDKDIKLFC